MTANRLPFVEYQLCAGPCPQYFLNKYLFICLFIWLCWASVAAHRIFFTVAHRIFSCSLHMGSCSLTRDRTQAPCIGSSESCSHWTTRELPVILSLKKSKYLKIFLWFHGEVNSASPWITLILNHILLRFFFWLKTDSNFWDFPDNPVVKTLPSNAWGVSLIPGQAAKIPCGKIPQYYFHFMFCFLAVKHQKVKA